MITVISATKKFTSGSIQERNIAKTIGVPYEYLPVDISNGVGLAAAYNYAVSLARGNICVFIPDDVYFMKVNWGAILQTKFADQSVGLVGVAGTQFLFADRYSITAAGRPFIKGRFVQHLENGDFFAVVFSIENGDFDVVACDGVFMAMPKSIFKYVRFDEKVFNGHYFHDLDISMQIRRGARVVVTTDILVKRRSQLQFDNEWHHFGRSFIRKYARELPAGCTQQFPDPAHFISSNIVDLKGKAPMATIC